MRASGFGAGAALVVSATFIWATATVGAQQPAQAPGREQAEFFETRVRPVLFKSCFTCHGPDQQMGGLRLDSAAALQKGGKHGPAITGADPGRSLLVQAIGYAGKVKMPPAGKLKPDEIEALTAWVKAGATWPKDAPGKAAGDAGMVVTPEQRRFWSFLPVRRPAAPAVKNRAWVANPIDAFVLSRLEKRGLQPAPKADRRTLIRRAYYDLVGLPPSASEVDAFVADKSPTAWETVVDRLLASPHYGERWARHWLDIARYADTRGYVFTEDRVYQNAYTFRDYVIRSFNEDLPYDQFILNQLAADRLNLRDDRRPLAAMGFLTVGRRFLNNVHDIIDDRIDVTMRGFQGLTVNCARCHDHKYDPIPTRDYYSLYGIFASSQDANPPPGISPKEITDPYEKQNRKVVALDKQAKEIVRVQVRGLRAQIQKDANSLPGLVKDTLQKIRLNALPSDGELAALLPHFEAESKKVLEQVRAEIAQLKKTMPPAPEFGMALQDSPTPVNPHVFKRGNPNNAGPDVPRQFLAVLSPENRKPFTDGSGRLELAEAIASPANPLTARVMVNRVWQWHFGYGIVRTPSDFGVRGDRPTHPELLDWLASRFMAGGWKLKPLHRLILLSNTWQQSSDCDERKRLADPENRLAGRMNRRRLDLESLRDSLLAAAGRLDEKVYGPSVDIVSPPFNTRRTLYGFIDRQNLPGMFRTFDFASPDSSTPQRFRTTVPQQALFMMNSPFVAEQARALAQRPEVREAASDSARIQALYRIAYDRAPTRGEVREGLAFLAANRASVPGRARLASTEGAGTSARRPGELDRLTQYVQVLLMSNEFCFVD